MITVSLHGTPCCDTEFQALLEILTSVRASHDRSTPLYLLYTLTDVQVNKKIMRAQEQILASDQTFCAIVMDSQIIRGLVRVATLGKKNVKVCTTASHAHTWLTLHGR